MSKPPVATHIHANLDQVELVQAEVEMLATEPPSKRAAVGLRGSAFPFAERFTLTAPALPLRRAWHQASPRP
jgi:hypothetical protein